MSIALDIYDKKTKIKLVLSFVNWFYLSFRFRLERQISMKEKIGLLYLKNFAADSFIFSSYLMDLIED